MAKRKGKAADTTDVEETGMSGAPATMKPEIVTFLIVGRSPLLQNNPAEFIGNDDSGGGLAARKKKYIDKDEARMRTYKDPDGAYYHPCEAFKKAIIRAVTGKKFGKVSAPGIIKGGVFIVEDYALILDGDGKRATSYSIDRRSVVVNNKGRVMRCRPVWKPWQIHLALEVDTAILLASQVEESLALAGRIIGIGDYRPERGGDFGRFTATLVK